MQSDQDRIYSSEDSDANKKSSIGYVDEKNNGQEEYYDMNTPGMRYYPSTGTSQNQMIGRNTDPMLGRPPQRAPSPHTNTPEDSDLTDAMVFLNRIKDEYADSLPVYDSFLETMRDFKFGKIDADEVCKAVRILFKDKPFLIRFFDEYLPHHLRYSDTRSFEQMSERSKFPPYRAPTHPFMEKMPMPMGRMIPQNNLPLGRPIHQVQSQNAYSHRPTQMGSPPSEIRKRPLTPVDEDPKRKMANDFIQLVKMRYANRPAIYKQFVSLIQQRSKNDFDRLLREVSILLSESPDLVEKFEKNFGPDNSDCYNPGNDPLKAIKESLAEKGLLENFLKIINFYNQNYINGDDFIFMVEPIIKNFDHLTALKEFIKYEDPAQCDFKKSKQVEKVGSYVILNQPFVLSCSPLSKEVLNNICFSVSTLESEEDTYIFRNKNSFEELLLRVNDERSESDLILDRIKYLIGKLEELYADLDCEHLELDDIHMSAAIVKETLKKVYESRSSEILEAILENPRKAIPVVLRRLYKVYKDNLLRHRQHRKAWRTIVNECYFKSYDTIGIAYKSAEKNILSLRHILVESINPFSMEINNYEILDFIYELFCLFVKGNASLNGKKIHPDAMIESIGEIFSNIKSQTLDITIDFLNYTLYYYISVVYDRFFEVSKYSLDPITSNKMAVDINIQDDLSVYDRYMKLKEFSKELMIGNIETEEYEEHVRQLTDSLGYKLYNLKKIMSKVDNQLANIIDSTSDLASEDAESKNLYSLTKAGNHLCMKMVSNTSIE